MFVKLSPEKWRWLPLTSVPIRSCDEQLLPTVCWLRNQIVAGTLLVLACRLSTRSAGISYSLVPLSWLQLCSIHLQASSKRQWRNSTGNRITDRVVVTRIHAQCKHTHTGTHSVPRHAQISQRCVQQQNNPDDTSNPPCSTTNLFHYHFALLVGSNLMTSQ